MKRFNPNPNEGLTKEQVNERLKEKLNYTDVSVPTKTIKRIMWDNFNIPILLINKHHILT